MDDTIKNTISHQQWLINNGLANDMLKDNLFLIGSYLHPQIKNVLLYIDMSQKLIRFDLYTTRELFKDYHKYKKLLKASGKINAIRLKNLWKKHTDCKSFSFKYFKIWLFGDLTNYVLHNSARLDLDVMIDYQVKSLCGSGWKSVVTILNNTQYEEDSKKWDKGLPQ